MSTRIGVISDTHGKLPDDAFRLLNGEWSSEELANAITRVVNVTYAEDGTVAFEDAEPESVGTAKPDLILHAGDICAQSVLDELGAITRTIAVLGNNDYDAYWCSDGEVRDYRSITVDGVNIFMQHIPQDMEISLKGRPPLRPALVSTQPDLAIHGHTHVPRLEAHGARITLNPGSTTRGRDGSGHAAAFVDIEDERIQRIALIRLP